MRDARSYQDQRVRFVLIANAALEASTKWLMKNDFLGQHSLAGNNSTVNKKWPKTLGVEAA